jgi:HlyD family secretion protein
MALTAHKTSFYGRHRVTIWTLGIAAGVILLASFMSRGDIVPIRVTTAERGTIRSVISTNGKIEPVHNFEVHAPAATSVRQVLVREGDHVKRGQLLVKLNDATARSEAARALAQVRAAEAGTSAIQNGGNREEVLTLESQTVKADAARGAAQRRLDALKKLQQQGAASPGEVKEAESQLASAQADLQLLQQKQKDRYSKPEIAQVAGRKDEAAAAYAAAQDILKQMNVRAPFDGIVYSLPVRQGDYVKAGDLIVQEADLSKVLVRAFVDEPDVGRLQTGQRIEVTWDAIPGQTWQGALSTIPASLKLRGTRNVGEVTCIVDNVQLWLLPNVNVGVTIVTAEHKNALILPREAVRQDEKGSYVFVVADDQLQRRSVQTAISDLTQVELTEGVSEKTLVALNSTNPSKPLRDHLQIKINR